MIEYTLEHPYLQRVRPGEPINFSDCFEEPIFLSEFTDSIFSSLPFSKKKEDTTMVHNFNSVVDIKRNTLGDTRTAEKKPTFKEFEDANRNHIHEVERVMHMIADEIETAGDQHDKTKISHDGEFYRDFCKTLDNPKEKFEKSEWYQMHINGERHHILARTPDDVDLIDILEHVVDCCCAGKARNGEISPVVIPDDILQKAVANTVKLIDNNTRMV